MYKRQFRSLLRIQPVVETHLVNITVEYPEPTKAALFADTLAVAYMELNMDRALKSNQRAITWLQEQVKDYRSKKYESDLKVHEFRTENDLVGLSERYNSTLGRLETLQQAWGSASTDRIQVEAVYEELSSLAQQPDRAPLAQHLAASSPVLQELLTRRDALLQEKSRLATRAAEKHPEMVKLNRCLLYTSPSPRD